MGRHLRRKVYFREDMTLERGDEREDANRVRLEETGAIVGRHKTDGRRLHSIGVGRVDATIFVPVEPVVMGVRALRTRTGT